MRNNNNNNNNAVEQISSCKLNLANASDTCTKMCEIELNMYAKTTKTKRQAAETKTTKQQNAKRKHVAKNFAPCVGGEHIHIHKCT